MSITLSNKVENIKYLLEDPSRTIRQCSIEHKHQVYPKCFSGKTLQQWLQEHKLVESCDETESVVRELIRRRVICEARQKQSGVAVSKMIYCLSGNLHLQPQTRLRHRNNLRSSNSGRKMFMGKEEVLNERGRTPMYGPLTVVSDLVCVSAMGEAMETIQLMTVDGHSTPSPKSTYVAPLSDGNFEKPPLKSSSSLPRSEPLLTLPAARSFDEGDVKNGVRMCSKCGEEEKLRECSKCLQSFCNRCAMLNLLRNKCQDGMKHIFKEEEHNSESESREDSRALLQHSRDVLENDILSGTKRVKKDLRRNYSTKNSSDLLLLRPTGDYRTRSVDDSKEMSSYAGPRIKIGKKKSKPRLIAYHTFFTSGHTNTEWRSGEDSSAEGQPEQQSVYKAASEPSDQENLSYLRLPEDIQVQMEQLIKCVASESLDITAAGPGLAVNSHREIVVDGVLQTCGKCGHTDSKVGCLYHCQQCLESYCSKCRSLSALKNPCTTGGSHSFNASKAVPVAGSSGDDKCSGSSGDFSCKLDVSASYADASRCSRTSSMENPRPSPAPLYDGSPLPAYERAHDGELFEFTHRNIAEGIDDNGDNAGNGKIFVTAADLQGWLQGNYTQLDDEMCENVIALAKEKEILGVVSSVDTPALVRNGSDLQSLSASPISTSSSSSSASSSLKHSMRRSSFLKKRENIVVHEGTQISQERRSGPKIGNRSTKSRKTKVLGPIAKSIREKEKQTKSRDRSTGGLQYLQNGMGVAEEIFYSMYLLHGFLENCPGCLLVDIACFQPRQHVLVEAVYRQCVRWQKTASVVNYVIEKQLELPSSSNLDTLFREDSAYLSFLIHVMRGLGATYISELVHMVEARSCELLLASQNMAEKDRDRGKTPTEAMESMSIQCVEAVFDAIISSKFPSALVHCLAVAASMSYASISNSSLSSSNEDTNSPSLPSSIQICIVALLFLRCICPVFIQPQKIGLDCARSKGQRDVILRATKIIQSAVSDVCGEEDVSSNDVGGLSYSISNLPQFTETLTELRDRVLRYTDEHNLNNPNSRLHNTNALKEDVILPVFRNFSNTSYDIDTITQPDCGNAALAQASGSPSARILPSMFRGPATSTLVTSQSDVFLQSFHDKSIIYFFCAGHRAEIRKYIMSTHKGKDRPDVNESTLDRLDFVLESCQKMRICEKLRLFKTYGRIVPMTMDARPDRTLSWLKAETRLHKYTIVLLFETVCIDNRFSSASSLIYIFVLNR